MDLRVGVAGFGRRAKGHIRAIQSLPAVRLSAICDPVESARFEAQSAFGGSVSVFDSTEEMVDSGDVEAVVVAVPAHLNNQLASVVVERGIPVLVEKPPGLNCSDVEDLKDATIKSGARVMVAFNRRFNPLIRAALDEVRNRGEVHHVVAEFHKDIHDFTEDPRYSPKIMDLMLLESPIHSVDLVTHIANAKFDSVHSIVKRAISGYRDIHAALIEFENGVLCQFSAAYTAGGRLERYEVHGEYVSAYLEGVQRGWILEPESNRLEIEVADGDQSGTYAQMMHFIECLRSGRDFGPVGADLDSSIETMRLCEAILIGTK